MAKTPVIDRPAPQNPKSLSGLLPFLKPYQLQIGLALIFLVLAAASTLVFPIALRQLIDNGMAPSLTAERLRGHARIAFRPGIA